MIQKTGQYRDNASGSVHTFVFDIPNDVAEFETLGLSQDELNKLALRMYITDARNQASATAQAKAGHNQRSVSEEQKEANKAKNRAQRALFSALAGKTPEELEALGVPSDVIDLLNK